jgi:hypothetical protein
MSDEDVTDDVNPKRSDHEWGRKSGGSKRLTG